MKDKTFNLVLVIVVILFSISLVKIFEENLTPDSFYIENGYKQEIYCTQESKRWILDEIKP